MYLCHKVPWERFFVCWSNKLPNAMELTEKNLTPLSAPQEEDDTEALVERLGLINVAWRNLFRLQMTWLSISWICAWNLSNIWWYHSARQGGKLGNAEESKAIEYQFFHCLVSLSAMPCMSFTLTPFSQEHWDHSKTPTQMFSSLLIIGYTYYHVCVSSVPLKHFSHFLLINFSLLVGFFKALTTSGKDLL